MAAVADDVVVGSAVVRGVVAVARAVNAVEDNVAAECFVAVVDVLHAQFEYLVAAVDAGAEHALSREVEN